MGMQEDRILTLHPQGKQGTRIDRGKYEAMRQAILRCVPRGEEGVSFQGLPRSVHPLLPKPLFEGASVTWYCVTVKLDLEARGEIERVPGCRPQHLRRP